jgi:hypothetical protein
MPHTNGCNKKNCKDTSLLYNNTVLNTGKT